MLRLEGMEIAGFKSFRERVKVQFPEGITGVVGPNGCGKSNLLDAICWVLGEQSAVALRGHRMQDLIFAGTRQRRPAPMAEVVLRLGAGNGSGEDRLDLARRLYQSGDSEYLLNGRKVRLRDISERLLGTGIGVRAYSIIHQGRVEEILSSRPEERRLLIEEAAGITRYRARRRSAVLKLERTGQDLLRVADILREVERQRNSLKRQAAAARRFRALKERERLLLRLEVGLRWLEVAASLAEAKAALGAARDREAEAARMTAETEALAEDLRSRLEQEETSLNLLRDAQHGREREIDRTEHQIATGTERAREAASDLQVRREQSDSLRTSLEECSREVQEMERAHERARADLERARTEVEAAEEEFCEARSVLQDLEQRADRAREAVFEATGAITEHRNAAEAATEAAGRARAVADRFRREAAAAGREMEKAAEMLASARFGLAAAHERHAEVRARRDEAVRRREEAETATAEAGREREEALTEESRAESRLALLRQLHEDGARCAGGVRALLEAAREAGVPGFRGLVADHLEVEPGHEDAVEAVLRETLQWVVVSGAEAAGTAARAVRAREAGGASFLHGVPQVPDETSGPLPDGAQPLAGAVRCGDPAAAAAVAMHLNRAYLVSEAEVAREMAERHPGLVFVTPEGASWGPGPVLHQQGSGGEGGVLRLRREMREAEDAFAAASHRRASAEARFELSKREHAQRASKEQACDEGFRAAERRLFEAEHEVAAASQEMERLRSKHAMLIAEAERAESEAVEHEGAAGEARDRERVAAEQRRTEGERHERLLEEGARASNRLGALESDLRRLREVLADHRETAEAARLRLEHAERRRTETGLAIERLVAEMDQMQQRHDGLLEEVRKAEASLGDLLRQRDRAGAELSDAEEATSATRASLHLRQAEARERREAQERAARATGEVEVRLAGLNSDAEHLRRDSRNDLGEEVERIASSPPPPFADGEPLPAGWDDPALPSLDRIAEDLGEVRAKIERIGSVNLVAIEEFEELEQRYNFLRTQKEDIESSVAALQKTIREMDRISRDRFSEAFERVREHFQQNFRILFKGGEADIRLQDSDDVLEAGIEIYAQPPGKRLQNIRLLSGGEKALSAIALLFALFRYKPSPFCVLDEVDAPLDDMNLNRFLELINALKEETQFVLITHNRLSMERANVLYGVTMEEPGCSKLVSVDFRGWPGNGNGHRAGNGHADGNGRSVDAER